MLHLFDILDTLEIILKYYKRPYISDGRIN